MANADDFLMKEYELLWKEVEGRLKEIKHVETFGLGGIVVMMAWLMTHPNPAWKIVWWLPLVFSLACGVRVLAIREHFKVMATYFKKVEEHFLTDPQTKGLGWNGRVVLTKLGESALSKSQLFRSRHYS